MPDKNTSESEWREILTPEQYHVLREKGTEIPDTGEYVNLYEDGMYHCAACGQTLFGSEAKYESTTPGLVGWPAFSDAADKGAVALQDDMSLGMKRTEVVCANCGSHLGHLFPDESSPNGQHYCINSLSLKFTPKQ